MSSVDTLLSVLIILIIILIIYSRVNQQSVVQTLKDIKEGVAELKSDKK